jgi:hypothetical protein
MKMRSTFTVLGSLALLSSAPIAAADELAVEPSIVQCWVGPLEVFEEPIILICPGPYEIDPGVSIDPVIIDENGEGTFVEEETFTEEETFVEEETFTEEEAFVEEETFTEEEAFTEEEVTDGEVTDGGEEVGSEIVDDDKDFVIPFDWIRRGGGDDPQIYYSVTNFGGPAVTPTTVLQGPETSPIARQIGPNSGATTIEGKVNSGTFQSNRDRKGPVALVKEGRVFLR